MPDRCGMVTRVKADIEPVYEQLRALAGSYFRGKRADHTLQPTALVHEAYLRLAKVDPERFTERAHFLAVAATAMRQILTDHARRKMAKKRGGAEQARVTLSALPGEAQAGVDALDLDAALTRLSSLNPRQVTIVELRYFGGLTVPETAAALEVSVATIEKEWRRARAWLHGQLGRTE